MLYGISGRFQTLSRTVRQVAHALLTRPPLTQGRSPSSVRLECVMHAASVHPEPGSNSRKICIKTPRRVIQSFELDCSLPFCLSSILFKNCEICFTHGLDLSKPCFVLISYCSIFNDRPLRFRPVFLHSCAALVLYHFLLLLSIPFSKFFQNFFSFSVSPLFCTKYIALICAE